MGIIHAIITLVLAKKATTLYNENQELYTGFQNVKTGKILAIVGIALGAIYLIYVIFVFASIGMDGYMKMIEEIKKVVSILMCLLL